MIRASLLRLPIAYDRREILRLLQRVTAISFFAAAFFRLPRFFAALLPFSPLFTPLYAGYNSVFSHHRMIRQRQQSAG